MKYILTVLFIIILGVSCEKDIEIDVPPQTTKFVVNGLIRVNTAFSVSVSKTVGILDTASPATYKVTNALVQLYENNILKDTLVYQAYSNTYLVKRYTRPQAGNTYRLTAAAPDFTAVVAETVTPAPTSFSITKRVNVKKDGNGNYLDEVKITFTDDASTANYYLIKLRRPLKSGGSAVVKYGGIYCMHSSDKDIDRRSNGDPTDFENCIDQEFFMSDKNFNGQVKEILLFIQHNQLEPMLYPSNNGYYKPVVELHTITYDHYKYRKSYDAYRDAEDNPFAEPVLVFSNVKNGYGVFSTFDLARDTIR
jgi:Neuraminidase (sialidase)